MSMNHVLLRDAQSEHQRGNLAEAVRLYGEVLRDNPNDADALCMLGLVHMQGGEISQANAAADIRTTRVTQRKEEITLFFIDFFF